jgi:predicted nuclease of predicted toxin-antitoxin system
MRILIDECLSAPIKDHLVALGHECETVREAGFGSEKNGELLALAEGRWDFLMTSDRNLKHQRNMTGRKIAILVLLAKSNRLLNLLPLMPEIVEALRSIQEGQVVEIGLA